jgi:trehalose 6-phosphate synthase/phosphatase
MSRGRIIVASARLPVTLARRQGKWVAERSAGGLVTALDAVAGGSKFVWIGLPGGHVADEDREAMARRLRRRGCTPVFVGKAQYEGFYDKFANRVLWPLFHNLANRSRFDAAGYKAFEQVNAAFADVIGNVAQPGDIVWVHDYQLALVPEMLRQRGLSLPIGFFLHIPFPSAETYRVLAPREAILRGMLGADLLGFHSYEYVSHFRSACLRVLGLESELEAVRLQSRRAHLVAMPIGIDPDEVTALASSPAARAELAELRRTHRGKKIVVGVDRLDYTKGIPERLRAFAELLRGFPVWRQKVVLIQVAAPSRTDVDEYQDLKREVDELVGRINGRYGTSSYTPVIYVNQNVGRDRLAGLYRAADVALVTPLRDGMNLVALEYVAARNSNGGTLILSEFAGAAQWLPGARRVNPYDVAEVAKALDEALAAKLRDSRGFSHMRDFVMTNTAQSWANRFIGRLRATAEAMPEVKRWDLSRPELAKPIRAATNPLVLLDYDGTLRSFEIDPDAATPDPKLRSALDRLARVATLYVVSGRTQKLLDEWLGDLPIGLVCEHGLAIKRPGGRWEARVRVRGDALRRLVGPIFRDFVQRTPGSSIEHKRAAIAWHYRGADAEVGTFQANLLLAVLEDLLKRRPYGVLHGSRVIEVRQHRVTKAHALHALLHRHRFADLLLCVGDDRTDEEMMAAIPRAWRSRAVTCWVGARNAHASYWVDSSATLLTELERLAEIWSRR